MYQVKMGRSLITILTLLTFFCGLAVGTRTSLFPVKIQNTTAAVVLQANDGVCASMVEPQGYTCEEHTVTTQDGYILSVQTIPVGKSGATSGNKAPVLLQHGLLTDGITWLLFPPEQSLAFALADNGFDVWIANTRGTKYSRGHTSLSPNDAAYWDWSWDELVAYDLPATFNYVHDQTGQNLHYVGHSLGTLTALAAFSKSQEVNILRSAALLCPIAYVGQITSPLGRTGAFAFLAETLNKLGISEFDLSREAVINPVINAIRLICQKNGIGCTDLWATFTDPSIVDLFLSHEPQPTSIKNMIHHSQMVREGTITMYDYNNEDDNKKHYGQATPPVYNMESIPNQIPLFLSYGTADALSDVNDVNHLLDTIKGHDKDKLVVQQKANYSHADFVMAENAKEDVYDPLMAFLKLY